MNKQISIHVSLFFGLMLLIFNVSKAQLTDFKNEKGLYGFKNSSGTVIVQPKYNSIYAFKKDVGLAAVSIDKKWGFIDQYGKEVIAVKYDELKDYGFFRDGLEGVSINGKWGFIDKTGNEVIPIKYESTSPYFVNGIAQAKLDNKRGWIKKDGSVAIAFKYDETIYFQENRAAVKLNGKWGYIDNEGKEVTPLKYDYADAFSNGFAYVSIKDKSGYLDIAGKEITPIKYKDVHSFGKDQNIAIVSLNGKWGYVDKTGKEVIKYDKIEAYTDNRFAVAVLKGKKGLISKAYGAEITPQKYTYISRFNSKGLACVNTGANAANMGGKWGFIDETGKEVIPLIYDEIPSMEFSDGLVAVKSKGKYGFIDEVGKVVIPARYDEVDGFRGGKAEVTLGKKTLFIDKTGQEVK